MTDKLSEMVEGFETKTFPTTEEELDINVEEKETDQIKLENQKVTKTKQENLELVQVKSVSFSKWFTENEDKFDNVRQIKLSVRGIDPAKIQIFSALEPGNEKSIDGNEKRRLHLFNDIDKYFVLDIKAVSLDMFNNGIKIINYIEDKDIYLKCYGIRTALYVINCLKVGDNLIPYYKNRLKLKNDSDFSINTIDIDKIKSLLSKNVDIEGLQILYHQVMKDIDSIKTNQDMVNYLCKKQETVIDINHHIQIDDVMISLLFPKIK